MIKCIEDLPVTGGTADARRLKGVQHIDSTITITKPVRLLLGPAEFIGTGLLFNVTAPDVIIEGAGEASTILTVSAQGQNGVQITGHNGRITNLTLRGPCAVNCTQPGTAIGLNSGNTNNIVIRDVTIERFSGTALNTGGNAQNWRISDSIIQDNYADGVFLAGGRGHLLEGTVIRRNGANGIDINSAANEIRNNWVYDNGRNFSAIDCFGILVTAIGQSVDNNIVAGNKVYRNHCQGVIVRADERPYTANSTIIVNNDVWGQAASNGYGINVDTSVGPKCGAANKTLIVGNRIAANAAGGVLIGGGHGSPCTVDDTLIFANKTLNNAAFGIQVSYGSHARVVNNVSSGNTLGPISLRGSEGTIDSGNVLDEQTRSSSYTSVK